MIAQRPKLLVSVRDLAEAQAALSGGCDWLDVKNPAAGSLGAATLETLISISTMNHSFSAWSAAMGELHEFQPSFFRELAETCPTLSLVKIGLSQCKNRPDWLAKLLEIKQIAAAIPLATVFYADRNSAESPSWGEVVVAARELESPVILIDTYSKNGQTLTDHLPIRTLAEYRAQLADYGIDLALAGSLKLEQIAELIRTVQPYIVAVRGAACKAGRDSEICSTKVALLKRIMREGCLESL